MDTHRDYGNMDLSHLFRLLRIPTCECGGFDALRVLDHEHGKASELKELKASEFKEPVASELKELKASEFKEPVASELEESKASEFKEPVASELKELKASELKELEIILPVHIYSCRLSYLNPLVECIVSEDKNHWDIKHKGSRKRLKSMVMQMDTFFLFTWILLDQVILGQRRIKVCHGCGKHVHYEQHTDNKNHRCNCRICMNSLLRFTDLSAYEINIPLCYPSALVRLSESAEFRDILSHFCDVDILQVCVRGVGGFDRPFPLQWVPQVPRRLVRVDDPLKQICNFSILESPTLSILDFFERRELFRMSMHFGCFLQITKDVVCYLSNKRVMLSLTFHKPRDNSLSLTIINYTKPVPLPSKGLKDDVEEVKSGSTSSSSPENTVRTEITRHLLKEFFLQEGDSTCLKYETAKDSSQERENIGIKKNKQGEKQESLDEDYYEIFTRLEVRRPVEVLVYPATQQRVLEPILNKFATPESTPSKHETMAVEFLRLCTMHDYPSTSGPSLLRLAQAGFYYEGNGNELVCFSCDFRKGSWNYHDSPREIHQRMSPNCKFLSQSGDGNIPIPREESTQDPPRSSPLVGGEVMADGPRSATAGEPANNTAHLASANCIDGQDPSVPPRRPMIVKHPEYANRATRLASYANFPRHMKQHPADMTDAGFYYAGFGDCCRCYHCGIGLRNWDPEDNPWIEHARWSSECPYILKVKGQAFIDLVQEAARAAEMAQDEDSEGERDSVGSNRDVGSEKSGASYSSSGGSTGNSRASDELVENNVAKTSEATVSKGVSSGDSGFGSGSTVQAQPIKAPLRTAAAQSLIHDEKIKPKYVTAAIEDLVKAEGWGAFTKENIRKYLKINEENGKSTPSASNADPDVLKQQNKELKDLTVCKICLDEKVSIVFLPCGHLVACPQCAPALTKCPICRKNIKGTVRTNLVEKSAAK